MYDKVFARAPALKEHYRIGASAHASNHDATLGKVDTRVSTDYANLESRFSRFRNVQLQARRRCDKAMTLPSMVALHKLHNKTDKRR